MNAEQGLVLGAIIIISIFIGRILFGFLECCLRTRVRFEYIEI